MSQKCNRDCKADATDETQDITNDDKLFEGAHVSEYHVPKMDCPSEEGMIRMALDSLEPSVILEFDTHKRIVRVFHHLELRDMVEDRITSLGLGARL
ncbi:MAG: cation transporter, partial [Kangiella sp.]|nr:cation transporter [Kangiella sp.]